MSLPHRPVPRARLPALLLLALAACGGGATPPPTPPGVDVTPVAAADPGSALPADWSLGPFMEIYVRGYQDSDGDGIGDLAGLTQRLDHLQALGVTGLWLMPVNASQDHDHGYAVADYRAIEPKYGGQAALQALLEAAHARGMGVIIDYVMNHSAWQNPLFQASLASAPGGWRDWYVWADGHPTGWSTWGHDPWRTAGAASYYAPFSTQMPDFNLRNPAVVGYHHDNLRYWLNRGVDGFRFDAVGVMVENGPTGWAGQPESYALMAGNRSLLDGYAGRFMVCEDPDGSRAFEACGAAFDFRLAGFILQAVNGAAGAPGFIANQLSGLDAAALRRRATFLANHDSFTGGRVLDQVGGDEQKARLAAATLLTLPGTPFLYYGEEVGMRGAANLTGDWRIRTPMSWSDAAGNAGFTTGTPFRALAANAATHNAAAEAGQPGALLEWYRSLVQLRRAVPALAAGSLEATATPGGTALAFQRAQGSGRAQVVLNFAAADASVTLAGLPAGATLTGRFPPGTSDATVAVDGTLVVTVPARSPLVYTWTQ